MVMGFAPREQDLTLNGRPVTVFFTVTVRFQC